MIVLSMAKASAIKADITSQQESKNISLNLIKAERWPGNGVRVVFTTTDNSVNFAQSNDEFVNDDSSTHVVVLEERALEKKNEKKTADDNNNKIILKNIKRINEEDNEGTTTIILASRDGRVNEKMLLSAASLIWTDDFKEEEESEKVAVFALRLIPDLLSDYTSNREHVLRQLKSTLDDDGNDGILLNYSKPISNDAFRLLALRRTLSSMPPEGLQNRVHHDVAILLDHNDDYENLQFIEDARKIISEDDSSRNIRRFVSFFFVDNYGNTTTRTENNYRDWFRDVVLARRRRNTFVASACNVPDKDLDYLLKKQKLILSLSIVKNEIDDDDVAVSMQDKNICQEEAVLKGEHAYPFFDTITLKMDFTQRNEFEKRRAFYKGTYYEAIEAKRPFSLTVSFENAFSKSGQTFERKAEGQFRGTSTFRDCERRKPMKINLEGKEKIKLGVNSKSDKFLLISLCYDDRYVKSYFMYSLLRKIGLFDLEKRYVRIFVETNNVTESEGLYLLIEDPVTKRVGVKARLESVVRRRLDPERQTRPGLGAPDVKFPNKDEYARAQLRNEYDRIAQVANECNDLDCYPDLKRIVDIDAYLRWIAWSSATSMGDYVDEIYFYASAEGNLNKRYWAIQAWDPDDAFQKCHHNGIDAIFDPFGMLYCLEGSMDVVFVRSTDMYERFVETLETILKKSLTDEIAIACGEEQKEELKKVLIVGSKDNDDVSKGMLELRRQVNSLQTNKAALNEMSFSLLYYIDRLRRRRRELFRIISGFKSFKNRQQKGEEKVNKMWASVRVESTPECTTTNNDDKQQQQLLKIRVSERIYDKEERQEIVFEFANASSSSITIEIPLDLRVVYKFNETYSEKYLPEPVEKEIRVSCWAKEYKPSSYINLNATFGDEIFASSCIAGEDDNERNVTVTFTNKSMTFTLLSLNGTKASSTVAENYFVSVYHGFFHPFFSKLAGVEYARILSC